MIESTATYPSIPNMSHYIIETSSYLLTAILIIRMSIPFYGNFSPIIWENSVHFMFKNPTLTPYWQVNNNPIIRTWLQFFIKNQTHQTINAHKNHKTVTRKRYVRGTTSPWNHRFIVSSETSPWLKLPNIHIVLHHQPRRIEMLWPYLS